MFFIFLTFHILFAITQHQCVVQFSGLFVAISRKIRRHAKGKGPEEDAATPVESLEHRGSQHHAALPSRTCT